MLCVCITLAKTIYNPTNSTNPAQLLSTPVKGIHTRRNRETRHIQANPVGGSSQLEEIWPQVYQCHSAQVYQWLNITEDDIYRAINVYEKDIDEWPTCDDGADIDEISTETTNCAAFNVVITSASTQVSPEEPWFFVKRNEIWPPTAREYVGLNITTDDIYRAINVYEAGDWPIRRGISCETVSCAAFNLVYDIAFPPDKPLWWPDEEIWPPRARIYERFYITAYDIYRAIHLHEARKSPICRGTCCKTINCATISCAAFNLVFDIADWYFDKPWYWPDEEIWPPRARVYESQNITAYDIYRAINVYENGFDEWPICRGISFETISCATVSCAAFNLVFDIAIPGAKPWYWPDEEIWPPRARVYEGINITAHDIHGAMHLHSTGKWPICRGISCKTKNCATISCAAFNLFFDIAVPHDKPWYWPDEEIWPPRARVYEGLKISAYDIYIAINDFRNDDEGAMCTGPDAEITRYAARNLLVKEYKAIPEPKRQYSIVAAPRPCGPCRFRKAGGKCVWSRHNCTFRGRSRRLKAAK